MLKIKKVKPMFTKILTTMDKYEDNVSSNGIIDVTKTKGTIKEYQKIISIGNSVRNVKEGDLICIDPKRYAVRKHQEGSLKNNIISDNPVTGYNFNVLDVDGVSYLLLDEADVSFIVEEYEETKEESTPKYDGIIIPDTSIIQ